MTKCSMLCKSLIICSLVAGLGLAPAAAQSRTGTRTGGYGSAYGVSAGSGGSAMMGPQTQKQQSKALAAITHAQQALRAGTDESRRQELIQGLEKALRDYFDEDTDARDHELQRLKERAAELARKLDKRASMKDELIDLQIKAIQFDVDGMNLLPLSRVIAADFGGYGMMAGGAPGMAGLYGGGGEPGLGGAPHDPIRAAREKLKAATDEAQTATAIGELKAALSDYFDTDMKARKGELDAAQQQLTDMEAQLKRRLEAKDNIIALHLQLLIHEADGLGFFNGDAPRSRSASAGGYPSGPGGGFGSSGLGAPPGAISPADPRRNSP